MSYTITVKMTVYPGEGMGKDEVMGVAQRLLPDLLDGTDFTSVSVEDAVEDEM